MDLNMVEQLMSDTAEGIAYQEVNRFLFLAWLRTGAYLQSFTVDRKSRPFSRPKSQQQTRRTYSPSWPLCKPSKFRCAYPLTVLLFFPCQSPAPSTYTGQTPLCPNRPTPRTSSRHRRARGGRGGGARTRETSRKAASYSRLSQSWGRRIEKAIVSLSGILVVTRLVLNFPLVLGRRKLQLSTLLLSAVTRT